MGWRPRLPNTIWAILEEVIQGYPNNALDLSICSGNYKERKWQNNKFISQKNNLLKCMKRKVSREKQ